MTKPSQETELEAALDVYQVSAAMQGDKRAFDLLYRRWHPRLLRLACRLSGNADAGQDVMQEAALTLARNIHRLQKPESFSAWAYTIIRRRAADHIHKAVRQREIVENLPETSSKNDTEDRLSLKQALMKLPDEDRLLLTLFYLDGLTGPELSAAMGVPLGTIKSRLFTARNHLKSIYDISEGDEYD